MKKAVAMAFMLLLLGGCSAAFHTASPAPKRYEAQFLTLFDTVTTIVGYSESKEMFTAQVQSIHDDLEWYHQRYDIYQDYEGVSNIKTINDSAGKAPVKVEREVIDLLLFAREMNEKTAGNVNVALGSVLAVWHDYRERGIDDPQNAALPPIKLLREMDAFTNINAVVIDELASTVFLPEEQMRLDVGAVAKGYAVQRVCERAKANGFQSGLISVGGNVCAIGTKQPDEGWKIGLQNPWKEQDGRELLGTVELADRSLVTSGVYQRYYTVAGERYHHIIEPQSLLPSNRYTAVSIVCRDSGIADALSTAVFNLSYEAGRALVEGMDDVQALWIFPDGEARQTAGFPAIQPVEESYQKE